MGAFENKAAWSLGFPRIVMRGVFKDGGQTLCNG
jgi:hypothetical protein